MTVNGSSLTHKKKCQESRKWALAGKAFDAYMAKREFAMHWIYSTHLKEVASFPGVLGAISLDVWVRSGGCPWDKEPKRYPVRLGNRSEIAARFGVSKSTIKRHWPAFLERFEECDPGRYLPKLEAWPEPLKDQTKSGAPVYVRIHPSALRSLLGLFHKEAAKRAAGAFRIACRLLPVLRSPGSSAAFASSQVSSALGMSKTAFLAARRVLVDHGLAAFDCSRGYVCALPVGLLSEIPHHDSRRGVGSNMDRVGSNMDPSYIDRSKGNIKAKHRAPARDGACLDLDKDRIEISRAFQAATWPDSSEVFPDLSTRGALKMAGYCESLEDVGRWLEMEKPALRRATTKNPAGLLLHLAATEGSRPPTKEALEKRRGEDRKSATKPWNRHMKDEQPKKMRSQEEMIAMEHKEAKEMFERAEALAKHAETCDEWGEVKTSAAWVMSTAGAWKFTDLEEKAFALRMRAEEEYEEARRQRRADEAGLNMLASNWQQKTQDQKNKSRAGDLFERLRVAQRMGADDGS